MTPQEELADLRARARMDELEAKAGGQQAPPAQAQPNTLVDMARSVPGGLAKGAASMAGLPGDIVSMGQPANAPAPQGWLDRIEQATRPANVLPRSGTIAEALAAPFGGYYKPKTTAGEYTETVASFAPAAIAPGSVGARISRAVVPGVASEAGGQLTKGTPLEPYARIGGALLGGAAQGLGEGYLAERAQTAATPTTAQVQQGASDQYRAIRGTPVTITPEMDTALSGDLGRRAIDHAIEGAEARPGPEFQAIGQELRRLRDGMGAPTPGARTLSVDAADRLSRSFRDIGRGAMRGETPNTDLSAGAFARRAGIETTVGQVPEVRPARQAYAQGQKAADIDAAIQRAIDSPATPAGASGLHQAVKREFRALVRDDDFMHGLTDAEQAAVRRTANGTLTSNTLQRIGVFSPLRNHLSAMGELLAVGANPAAALGTAGAGIAGQVGGNFSAMRNARLASELARGGTAAPLMGAQARDAAAIAALLARPQ